MLLPMAILGKPVLTDTSSTFLMLPLQLPVS